MKTPISVSKLSNRAPMNGTDDFGFTPVAEAGGPLMLLSGVAALAVLGRGRSFMNNPGKKASAALEEEGR